MDQVRKVLMWLKEQHFWVLAALVAAIALWSWYSSASALQREFAANESDIKSQFSAVDGVATQAFIANDDINAKQQEEIEKQQQAVEVIWQQLYDRQSENVLEWPRALSPSFREGIKDLKFEEDIPRNMRDEYLNYIDRHFPELPKKIGAREMAASESGMGGGLRSMGMGRGGGYGGEGGYGAVGRPSYRGEAGYGGEGAYNPTGELEEDDTDYLVEWLDQGMVRDELNFSQRPSSLEIWVVQENLWVYHTLLNIIANTNAAKGADRISNAAVRRIYQLQVGQFAARAEPGMTAGSRIYMPPSASPMMDPSMMMGGEGGYAVGPEGGMGMEGSRAEYSPYGAEGGMGMGLEGMGADQERIRLLSGRYLDATGQPVQVTSPTPVPGEFGKEYKRLPVRMTLEMDLRWLTRLITECANQPLQVEVKEVRINPSDTGGMGGSTGYRGEGGFRGGGAGSASSPFASNTQGEIQTFKAQPNVGTVVLQGIIYIFNPPDMDAAAASSEQVALTP